MKKIDMGGFKNEEVEVEFGGNTYKIMLDPPIEITRMLAELEGLKIDSDDSVNKFKEFIATFISISNPGVDKQEFKKSLTLAACLNFIDGYMALLPKKKLEEVSQISQDQEKKE